MRIIIPNTIYEDNFEDNVAYTLRRMGHTVLTMPEKKNVFIYRYKVLYQTIRGTIWPNHYTNQEKWLLFNVKEFKPDILLCLTQEIKEEVLVEIKKLGIITVVWWGDTPANMKRQGLLVNGWDFIYIKDKFAANKLGSVGLNAHYLPEAMNPDWHKMTTGMKSNKILFAGNVYDYRHFLLRKLISEHKYHLILYGSKLPRWANKSIGPIYTGRYIVKTEKCTEFYSALACINSTSVTEFDSLNCRAFEIAGAGGLQILEYRPSVEECFEPGKEILIYKSYDGLLGYLDIIIQRPDEFNFIRFNGNKRVLAEHTYAHRLTTIINNI